MSIFRLTDFGFRNRIYDTKIYGEKEGRAL